jgi:hypothetical protein
MRHLQKIVLLFSVALSACATTEVSMNSLVSSSPSSLITSSSSSSSFSSSTPSSIVQIDHEKSLQNLVREKDHNFFVVLATSKDKVLANNKAKDLGAWTLFTDHTSQFTPHLYAVVYGPFFDRETAQEKLLSLPTYILEQVSHPYVKDAGRLMIPAELQAFSTSVPMSVLAALHGRLSAESVSAIDIDFAWEEEGGTLCNRTSSVFVFTPTHNGQPIFDSLSPNEISLYKKLSRNSSPSIRQLQWRVHFSIVEKTGEVIGTQFCWD